MCHPIYRWWMIKCCLLVQQFELNFLLHLLIDWLTVQLLSKFHWFFIILNWMLDILKLCFILKVWSREVNTKKRQAGQHLLQRKDLCSLFWHWFVFVSFLTGTVSAWSQFQRWMVLPPPLPHCHIKSCLLMQNSSNSSRIQGLLGLSPSLCIYD